MNTYFNSFLNRTGNLLLLLIGMESICLLFCDSFGLIVSLHAGILLALLCVLLWIASSFRFGPLIGIPLCALILILLFRQSGHTISESFEALADQVVGTYYHHFSSSSEAFQDSESGLAAPALLSMLFLLAAFISFSLTSASFRISLARLATFPVFLACILVNGTPPVIPTLGVLVFWLGLQLSGDSYRVTDGAGKAFLLGIVPCILVLAGLLLLYRPSTYHYDERDVTMSQQFDRVGNLLSNWFGGTGASSEGSPASGNSANGEMTHAPSGWGHDQDNLDLTSPFDYSSLPQTAMTLRTDVSGTVYLRGKSYGDYLGTAWSSAVENSHGNALNYAGHSILNRQETEKHPFQLFTPVAYDILYLPYFTMTGSLGDISVPSDELTSYGGDFYRLSSDPYHPNNDFALPSSLVQEEQQYREFVHSYYTRLPESTRSAMNQVCISNGLNAEQDNILNAVSTFVRSQGIYDLSVEAYPDSDYAVYFLTVSPRGYCIHYATAAVALFRTLNIPARICEGYMVNSVPNANVRITGENAHAWAEVYLDGFGWIPVEVTASEGESLAASQSEPGEVPETGSENALDSGNSEVPDFESDPSDVPSDESEAEQPETASDDSSSEESVSETAASKRVFLRILLWLLGIPALLAALLFGRYYLLRVRYESRFNSAGVNQKAILLYRYALQVSSYGAELPDSIRIPAEKAAFSQHELTQEEFHSSYQAFENMLQETYATLNRWERFRFRFLSGLL